MPLRQECAAKTSQESYLKNLMGLRMNGAKGTVMSAYSSSQNHCMSSCKLIMTMKNARMTAIDPQNHFPFRALSRAALELLVGALRGVPSSPSVIIVLPLTGDEARSPCQKALADRQLHLEKAQSLLRKRLEDMMC